MTNDKETIRLLKAEIHDLQQSSIDHMDDLNLRAIVGIAVREAINRSSTIAEAARMLGIDRGTLYDHMRKLGIEARLRCVPVA